MSHPMWVRGLKQRHLKKHETKDGVAPHVGAWIETEVGSRQSATCSVAPHVGAWIETRERTLSAEPTESHPMWVRGLKLLSDAMSSTLLSVAPHVGAWIETLG